MSSPDVLPPLDLPAHLAARTHRLNAHPVRAGADGFVLCWLHHALRDHENPALDVALALAAAHDLPVLVYQGLGGRHRFNADRHHTFILEAASDLARGLAVRGIHYAFWLPEDPAAPSPLRALVARASAFVTEDFPAPPFPAWTRRLAARAEREAVAAVAVDTACLAPLRSTTKRFTRAFRFRDATGAAWNDALRTPWRDVAPGPGAARTVPGGLGFDALDFDRLDIAEACARCRIDHSIPAVARTRGGMAAGYARWDVFVRDHLRAYDRRRNDAADMAAVSGLSPWLHYGCVSPFRIARTAHAIGGGGAEKFLDELLVWRELAFNFCAHTPADRLETLAALPGWAQATLAVQADDERPALHSWETMGRGVTGDRLWDAAQRSLVRNGELHNNVRMTWGKMIPMWTPDPETALQRLIDLNHRYALDGNDPNSYGGLLWCLGQFDRAFEPSRPVVGTIRPRSTEVHAERLDPDRYAGAVDARTGAVPRRVAVVGAGVAGLACARTLQDQGCTAVVFERGRGPGGRLATRGSRNAEAPESFDHGAPSFEVTDARFGRFVRSWIDDGVCARWPAHRAVWTGTALEAPEHARPLVVGTPDMNAIARHLAADLDVRAPVHVGKVTRDDDGYAVHDDEGSELGRFDAVVLAMPPAQAARLAAGAAALDPGRDDAIWAGLFVIRGAPAMPDLVTFRDDPVFELLVRDDAKPGRAGRAGHSVWVAHAHPQWSQPRYDEHRTDVADALAAAFARTLLAIAGSAPEIVSASAHRWGLARPAEPRAEETLTAGPSLLVCGDGCGGTGVEAAFLSGHAAAGRLLAGRVATAAAMGLDGGGLFDA